MFCLLFSPEFISDGAWASGDDHQVALVQLVHPESLGESDHGMVLGSRISHQFIL